MNKLGWFAFCLVGTLLASAFLGGCIVPSHFPMYGGGWGGRQVGPPITAMNGGCAPGGCSYPAGYQVQQPVMYQNPTAMVASQNMRAAAMVGTQQTTGPYVIAMNPVNPFGISDSGPAPGMIRIQTGCPAGQYFVPTFGGSGYCRRSTPAAFEAPGYWTPPGGVVDVHATDMNLQGIPGRTAPIGFGGYGQPF